MTNKKQYYIGVDIGGTNLKAVLLDENKKELESGVLATPKDSTEHFMIMMKALVDPLIKTAKKNKADIRGVGIGIPGLYDYKNDKIIMLPNLPILDGFNLKGKAEEMFELQIKIDNDANCFVRAEAMIGVGKKHSNIFGLTLGTDVGSGWWFGGQIYQGVNKCVDEIARMVIENPKNLETIYQGIIGKKAEELANRAYRGDKEAQEKFEELGYYLGVACANVVNLFDPGVLIIGGQVTRSSDLFMPKLRKTVEELAMHPDAKKIKILKAKIEGKVGAKGAGLLFS